MADPETQESMRVGIVGAGMAGLACARRLRAQGLDVALFDKGRRPGGRLSTLRLDGMAWDYGAQYLKTGLGAFAAQVAAWRLQGLVQPWPEGPDGALVAVPAMASLVEAQCEGLDVRFGAPVQRIESAGDGWHLSGPGFGAGPFAALVVAIPSEQAAPLVSLHDLMMARDVAASQSRPCWTAMAAFAEPLARLPAFLRDRGALAWAARDNSKPGRGPAECWVIQASAEWSQARLEMDRDVVAARLVDLFAREAGLAVPSPVFLKAHRWRFGLPYGHAGETLWNPRLRLGACGDWCSGPMIEGAWRAGVAMADRVSATLLPETASRAAG